MVSDCLLVSPGDLVASYTNLSFDTEMTNKEV